MKKKILALSLLGVALTWCTSTNIKKVSIDDFEKTYKVSTWSIVSNNKFVWTLQSNQTTYLGFKLPWRVTRLYVKEWDYVKAGQLLATLWWNEVKTQYHSAQEMINSLWAMYKSTENMFNAQIQSMQAKIAQAKAGMEGMKTGLGDTKNITKEQLLTAEKQVKQAEIWLQTAKTNLEHTKQVLKQNEKDIYSNSKNAIAQSKILLNNFIIFTDQLFGISDENLHKNDRFEIYLSAKNTALKEQIKTDWRKLNSEYENWKKDTEQLLLDIKNSDAVENDEELKNRIYENLKQTQKMLVEARWLADKVFTAIDSSVSSVNFPQSMINQYKKQVTTFQNNIEKALLTAQWNFILWVKGSIQNIENFKKQSKMKLDLLQKQYDLAKAAYETAKQTYEQYKAMSEWKVNEVNTKYEIAKKQYEEAVKWLEALKKQKQAQLSQIKSKIEQVKWNKNLAAVNLGNIKLYAPYNGVITKKMVSIWQVVWAWTPIYAISDPNDLKWVFYVPVEDVKNIKVWQKVVIKAMWKTIIWVITVVNPSADPYSKKVQVEVKIDKVPKTWKLGMFITGYPLNEKFSWIIVPHEFIHYEYGKAYVYRKISENKIKYEKTYIKLWKCDNDFCLVKKGLKANDIIK